MAAKKNETPKQRYVCRGDDKGVIGVADSEADATTICSDHRGVGRGHATFALEDWPEDEPQAADQP